MAQWEKDPATRLTRKRGSRTKFLIGGVLILAAAAYLMISGTLTGARYFITVDELLADEAYLGETVRISGAVIGETIDYDAETLTIEFTIAHLPQQFDDLALALHEAANNDTAQRLSIRVENEVMPDLLQHEAQAILTGQLGADGVFHANELLLKCPSRFEEAGPDQALAGEV